MSIKIPDVPALVPQQAGPGADHRTLPTEHHPLAAVIEATHEAALDELAEADPDADFTAIARLSGHLAAMRRTVYPAARGQPGAAGQLLATCLSRGREVDRALRLLHCRLSGDVFAIGYEVDTLSAWLRHRLGRYRPAEQALVAAILRRLTSQDRDQLAIGYRRALTRAPTRPHPHGPHGGPVYRLTFRWYGWWDRLLDTADSRPGQPPVPAGRPSS